MFYQSFFVGNLRKRLPGARFECHRNVALKRCFFFTIKSVESQRGLSAATLQHLKPEVVLSQSNRKSFVEKFKPRQIVKVLDEKVSRAAVLVPLCKHKGELGFLYTLRSTRMSTNRGQVSFPGGMYDKEDRHLEDTALRETWEELNIPREKVDVWTSGSIINKKGLKVMPVFGYIGEVDPNKLNINKDEVEEAFFLSLKNLCDPSLFRFTQFRDNYIMPVYLGEKHRVWGFTAAITHRVLNTLVPNAYKHKLVYVKPVLPQIEKLEKNIPQVEKLEKNIPQVEKLEKNIPQTEKLEKNVPPS